MSVSKLLELGSNMTQAMILWRHGIKKTISAFEEIEFQPSCPLAHSGECATRGDGWNSGYSQLEIMLCASRWQQQRQHHLTETRETDLYDIVIEKLKLMNWRFLKKGTIKNNFLQVIWLTVNTMAGRGVCRLVWIMARNLGRCPSRAAANTNLRKTKAKQFPTSNVQFPASNVPDSRMVEASVLLRREALRKISN